MTGRAAPGLILAEAIEHARWLDVVGDPLSAAVRRALPAGPVKDALSGTWLGHALHPLLTDVPIGAWTSSLALDFLGGRRSRRAADRLLAVGIVAALPTTATGLADWGDTQAVERRVGLVHAAANVGALVLYGRSLAVRRQGRRLRGIALSLAGAGALGAGGYLGGHLAYVRGLGVDRTAFERWPSDWVDAAADGDVGDGRLVCVDVDGAAVLLARDGGELRAIANRCTHRGAPLHEGELRDGCVVCPWHESIFRLADGGLVQGPATTPAPRFEVRVRAGRIELRIDPAELA
ncbi:MAG: Rieske 2Fe-2S domain-containing protein [Solirubrobacteraceae bacterium]